MDDADISQARMEREEALRPKLPTGPLLPRTGFCHWCEEVVPEGAVFCNRECSEDYERISKLKGKTWNR